jgi:ribonuclease BN (tRNA processing enzyme)
VDAGELTLTVLGSSGSYAGPGGACSGYLLQSGGTTVWLDAGSGTMANLQRHIPLDAIDAIVLSHSHPDHWSDVEGFYVACRYVLDRKGVPVYAPRGLQRLMRMGEEDARTLSWNTVADGGEIDIGPMHLRFSRTEHPVETLAVRVDCAGRAFGYSADSGPGWSLEALGAGLDLALGEATFLQDQEADGVMLHMSARQAGATAKAAGAGRLMITHLWPTVDPARAVAEATGAFGRAVELAAIHQRSQV